MGARKSAKYLFSGALFSKAVSFIGSIFLARLLFPEDFGYLLIASIVTGFIQVLGDVGFETFYLQEKIDSKEDEETVLNIIYKLRLLVNGMLFLLQIGVSYLAEAYYKEPIVGEMIRIFALSIPIMAFAQVNLYILRKKLDYKPEVYANVARDITGTLLKVLFAFWGFGALSFAVGAVAGNIVRLITIRHYQAFKAQWHKWDEIYFRRIVFFGKHSFLAGIGMYLTNQVDKILLSSFFPPYTVGNYYFASTQAQTVFTYILAPQTSLIMSYSANYKDNKVHLFRVLSVIGYALSIILLPVVIFICGYAHEIFLWVFGDKWSDSVYLFQIMLVYFFLTEMTFPFSGLITAYGRPEIASKLVFTRFFVLLLALGMVLAFEKNIYLYIYVFIGVGFFFSWIKAYIGIRYLMSISFSSYLVKLKPLIPLSLIYLAIIWISDYSFSGQWRLVASFIAITVMSFFLHLIWYRKALIEAIHIIFGKNHTISKRLSS